MHVFCYSFDLIDIIKVIVFKIKAYHFNDGLSSSRNSLLFKYNSLQVRCTIVYNDVGTLHHKGNMAM